jgi:hypothetical protein
MMLMADRVNSWVDAAVAGGVQCISCKWVEAI